MSELLALPAVRQRTASMPTPALLEHEDPPLASQRNSSIVSISSAHEMVDRDDASVTEASQPCLPSTLAPGAAVWAKHATDGLWHRGVIHSSIDADAYFVSFSERRAAAAPRLPDS